MNVIKLKSSDGKIFETNIGIVKCSSLITGLLKNCENVGNQNSPCGIIPLPKVSSEILSKVLVWANHHKDDVIKKDAGENYNISAWDKEFLQVDQRILFEIIMAANYLDIEQLLLTASRTVANMMTNKTPNEIRELFNIPNDFQKSDEDK